MSKRKTPKALLRQYAELVDACVGGSLCDSTAWIGIAFDLSAAADVYGGIMVDGYRPGMGSGSRGAMDELSSNYGSHVRRFLSRQRGETLAGAAILAYAYGTALEGCRETIKGYC